MRLDGFKDLSKTNSISGLKVNNITYNLAPELTYKTSEFTTFRSGLSHEVTIEEGVTTAQDTRAEVQIVFILGAHPAHNFYYWCFL